MSNAAYNNVIPFEPKGRIQERRMADLDDGYTRIANELLEAVYSADLTARQLKVVLAVIRKTYGFGKKLDRITNTQIASMTGIHHTHVCKAKNEMIEMRIIISSGNQIGVNKVVSDWNTDISQVSETLAKSANKSLAKPANAYKPTRLNTKETIQKKERKDPPSPQRGVLLAAQVALGYYNELTNSRCSATAPFEKALMTLKSKGQCYSVDEIKLVIRWSNAVWKHKAKPENIFRMTRFDGYLSDALIWEEGADRNPVACPHDELTKIWNETFPERSIESNEWNHTRPAYRHLERVWNIKTNMGGWREVKHMKTIFTLLRQSSLCNKLDEKPWLSLDWILQPKNWSAAYEQAKQEYKNRQGAAQ